MRGFSERTSWCGSSGRMVRFFESITAPGKDKLPQDRVIGNPNWRTQIKTKAIGLDRAHCSGRGAACLRSRAFARAGGMAIAALALASTMPSHGDYSSAEYLRTAEEAFGFLQVHNRELLNDGKENILDDYCALMAATELYTGQP